MKTKIVLFVLILLASIVNAQTAKVAVKPSIKMDGIYECKDYELINGNMDNAWPAYYRFFPDGSLLFCRYENAGDLKKDSMITAEEVFRTVVNQAMLDKLKESVAEDPMNYNKVYKQFKVTAYRYQVLPNGICFDILAERPNCLGKPNLKVPETTIIKTDTGDPKDDHYFKFVQVK